MPIDIPYTSHKDVPVNFRFTYGPSVTTWGSNCMSVSDISCRSEPIEGKFDVAEMRAVFSDTDGAIWGSLGRGTSFFGTYLAVSAYLGGSSAWRIRGYNESAVYPDGVDLIQPIFNGRITDVKRVNRTVEITARNIMSQVEDLEWEFPVDMFGLTFNAPFWGTRYGSNFFNSTGNYSILADAIHRPAFYNLSDDNTAAEFHGWVGLDKTPLSSYYPRPSGRGTMGLTWESTYFGNPRFDYWGNGFRQAYERVHFKGSYLGTYVGTINADEDGRAQSLGYPSAAAAETFRTGGSYVINRDRYVADGYNTDFIYGSQLYLEQAGITLGSTPAYLWREMLTGCCVTPLFSPSDIDTTTFATSVNNVAFNYNQQRIDPKGGKVLPHLKDLLAPFLAQWAIGVDNKFKLFTYGPKILSDIVGTIGSSHIISSQISSSEEDVINRITLSFAYDFETGSYAKRLEKKSSSWAGSKDYPLNIESKWIVSSNEASVIMDKLMDKTKNGIPRLSLELPLTYVTGDIGSFYAVEDTDCLTGGNTYEVSAWRHNFSDGNTVSFSLKDAIAYYRRGYARWEGDGVLTNTVSGTSTSGWGTLGTVSNINENNYGTMFVWF